MDIGLHGSNLGATMDFGTAPPDFDKVLQKATYEQGASPVASAVTVMPVLLVPIMVPAADETLKMVSGVPLVTVQSRLLPPSLAMVSVWLPLVFTTREKVKVPGVAEMTG